MLFGKEQSLKSSVYLPSGIERVDNWCPPSSGITRKIIAEKHTLYPYWAISYPKHHRTELDNMINGGQPTTEKNYMGYLKTLRSQVKYLRYCPLCAAEDVEVYGETYWHRQHQLSEMIYCMKHEIRLVDSVVLLKNVKFKCYPASSTVNLDYDGDVLDNLVPYKEKLIKIGRECEWLIANGLNVDWSVNGYEKYWRLLRDKGLASIKGYCNDHNALNKSFFEYWGKDFLDVLFDSIGILRFESWHHKFGKVQVSNFSPLYHILVMCWVADSVSGFVNSNPAETPFGHPPFVCENRICPHYHKDGAKIVDMVDYGQGFTAYFECSYCGMLYKHKKSADSREQRFIVDYGHLWLGELRRCCQDPTITSDQTMEILKCGSGTLANQKKKHGLMKPAPDYMGMEPEAYYKAKVLEVCQEYDEVTIALLDEKVPWAYAYLKKHDNDWIRSKIVFDNERRFRLERENLLLEKLRKIISTFETEGYPDEQLSYGFIASLVGSTRDELRFYRNRPQSKLRILLDDIIESRKTWRQERAAKIIEHRSKRGCLLLDKLRKMIATFEIEGYPDKQLSYELIADLIGSTPYELQYKVSHNAELQNLLDETVEHRKVWRQERAAKLSECRSKREIFIQNAIKQVWANPPQEQISRNYIAKVAGLGRDILKDKPYLAELTNGFVESRIDWHKRRFTEAYRNKPVRKKPYSAGEICSAASIAWSTFNRHRELFEEILGNLSFETE